MKSKTTIQISKEVREKLKGMRDYERQTYDDLLRRKLLDKKIKFGEGL